MLIEDGSYIFYADESGDHSLTSVDQNFPVFALSLCAFKKTIYCNRIVPLFQKLKFRFFGHDSVVLHEREIRKQSGQFRILTNSETRASFLSHLDNCVEKSSFKICAAIILKNDLRLDLFPENPYVISLRICLQQAYHFLDRRNELGKRTHFVFEKRGAKEDSELELEFRRIVSGLNDLGVPFGGFEIHFADKRVNSTGMQIADLTARPIGLSVLRPNQPNHAYELISKKVIRYNKYSSPIRGIYTLKKR